MELLAFILYLVLAGLGLIVGMRIFRAYERTLEARENEAALKLERQREMTLKAEGRWAKYYADIVGKSSKEKPEDPQGDEPGTNWDPKVIGALHGLGVDAARLEDAFENGDVAYIKQAISQALNSPNGQSTETVGLVG